MNIRRNGKAVALFALMAGYGCSTSTEAGAPSEDNASTQEALGENFASCTSGSGWTSSTGALVVDASASTTGIVIFTPGGGVVKVNGRTCVDTHGVAIALTAVKKVTLKGRAGASDAFVLDFSAGLPSGALLAASGITVDGQETSSTTTPDSVIFKGSQSADTVTVGQSATYATDMTIDVALTATSKVADIVLKNLGDPTISHNKSPKLYFSLNKGADVFSAAGGFSSTAALAFGISVMGGDDNDTITGGAGNDTLNGGPGNDTFVSASADGADSITGGGDSGDLVDYSGRASGHAVLVDVGSAYASQWGGDLAGVTMGTQKIKIDPGSGTPVEVTFASEATPAAIVSAINTGVGASVASLVGTRLLLSSTVTSGALVVDQDSDTAYTLLGLTGAGWSYTAGVATFSAPGNDGEAGEGDDVQGVANINGGAGNDVLVGSATSNTINGNAGDDVISGGPATNDSSHCAADVDVLNGGIGNDWFDMGSAADCSQTVNGGGDTDVVDYSKRSAALTIKMDGSASSGDQSASPHEADKIGVDCEILFGGSGVDTISGSPNTDYIFGGLGADVISAGAGDDHVFGGEGADTLNGEAGDDTFYERTGYPSASDATDPLHAVSGGKWAGIARAIWGASAKPGDGDDVVNGGAGNDKVDLNDAANSITVTLCIDPASTGVTASAAGCGAGGSFYGADDDDGIGGNTTNNYVNCEWVAAGTAGSIMIGTSADETFEGGAGVDVILGQGGNDTIYGYADGSSDNASADVLCGGDGDDSVFGGTAASVEGEGQMRTTGGSTEVSAAHNGDASAQDPSVCYGLGTTYSSDSGGQNVCFGGGAAFKDCLNQ